MRSNVLKRRLKAGEATVGSWLTLAQTSVAELMGRAGFDWLILDMEHGIIGLESATAMVQAIESTSAIPLVRVAWNDPVRIKQVLETGAAGLWCRRSIPGRKPKRPSPRRDFPRKEFAALAAEGLTVMAVGSTNTCNAPTRSCCW